MADTRKTEVVITCNTQQPKSAVRAMENELKRLTNTYNQLVSAGKAGTERAKKMASEIKELSIAVKEGKANLDKIVSVTNNLSNSSLSQLNRALRQVKKEMGRVSTDSPKLDDLRQKYKAISDQIKILQGDMVNVKKHMGDLSSATDSWLQRAINQQRQLVASTQKTSSAYLGQVNILHQLQSEQTRRSVTTISGGGASADALRTARANLVSYRDTLGKGGIMPASGNVANEIERINAELKKCDEQLDKIAGKEKQIELNTTQLTEKADKIILDPKKFSPKEIKTAIDEIQQKLSKLKLEDPARAKLGQSMKQLQSILNGVDKELVDIGRLLQPGNLKKASLETLHKAAAQLEAEMKKINRDETEFINKKKQLEQIRTEINATTGAVKKQSSAWQTTIRNLTAYMGLFQLFSLIQQKLTAVFRLNLQFSDQLADIRKVSGLAMADINKLSGNLANLDTRTTIQELNEIAYAGAKLGMGKYGIEGLEQFTRAANVVNVALKEDLGSDALTALSKITEVMGLIPKLGVEQSMLKVGSAMFQLSATSTATSNNIVEFAKRLTGMARTAGITTDQLLALGSASDSMFLAPEVASTAFNKLLSSLQTKHNLIEKELAIDPGTISSWFEQGRAMDAIVLIFDKMKEKGNMNALQSVFKDLGSDGARLVNVMVTMSKNVDMLKEHLETSAVAFDEATAVSNEYAIQQATANALMERSSNIWEKAFINPDGVDMVKEMAQSWYDLSKSITSNKASMFLLKGIISLIAVEVRALMALLPALLAGLMVKGVASAWQGVARSVGLAGNASVLAALQTQGLTAAWKALNVAQKANVISLVVSLLASLAIGLASVIKTGVKANQWMTGFNDTMSDFNREFAIGLDKLTRYKRAIEEAAVGTKQRQAAIRNFNKEFGQYLSKMLTEKSTAKDLATAYKEVVKQMKAKIALQLREKDIENQVAPRVGWAADRLTEYDATVKGSGYSQYNGTWLKGFVDDMRAAGKSVEEITQALNNRVFHLNSDRYANVYAQRGSQNIHGKYNYYTHSSNWGVYTQTTEDALTGAEKALHAAIRYAQQAYSADNAMNRVNRKWKPFEDDINSLNIEDNEGPGTLELDAADKEEQKRRKAEEAARRKVLRAEMREEQEKAKAIIDNVKNYYERQIAAITEMATSTGMSEEWQKKMTDGMAVRMNAALANVRQALAGTENEWNEFRQTMLDDLYEPLGDDGQNQSTQLLDNIIHNDIDKLRRMIAILSKELGQNGSVLLDQIWRKATENELATARQQNKAYQQRQQVLLEKNYTGKVNRDYENQMEQLGVADLTAGQTAQLMGWSQAGNQEAIQQFVNERSQQWQAALHNAREHIVEVLTSDGKESLFDIVFPGWQDNVGQYNILGDIFDVENVLDENGEIIGQRLKMEDDRFKVFFQKLVEYSDAYTDAQKKAYDEAKRRADFVFNNRTDVLNIDQTTNALDSESKDYNRFDTGNSMAKQIGLRTDDFTDDPELLRYRLLAERAKLYYAEMKQLREQDRISEQQLTDAKQQMLNAQANMADKVAAKFHERVQMLQSFSEPLATFAEGVGEYLGNMIADTEDTNVKMKDLAKQMLKAYAKMTIQLMAEDLTRRVTKRLYQRQEEADETLHQQTLLSIQQMYQAIMLSTQATSDAAMLTQHSVTNQTEVADEAAATSAKVPLGIAGGAAKIIGTLGFWGIPLIAVISALLMGLLSWAISAAFGGSDSSSAVSAPNVKLATGMLTYDGGNVQSVGGSTTATGDTSPVLGSDGKVYQAHQVDRLQTGIVTHPIATLVNGQPSLVGEKGPEIVIGRETTAAMQMARPDLINEIVKFDRNFSGSGFKTYDSGNLSDFAGGIDDTTPDNASMLTSEDVVGLRDALSDFTQMMLLLQRTGLHVNKFGRGGITEESANGANFMRRNSGDRLWRKG